MGHARLTAWGLYAMSGVDAESVLLALDGPMGCYPRRVLLDFNTGRLWSQQMREVVGNVVRGPVADHAVDDSIPRVTTIGRGGSLPNCINDPSRWLVSNRGEAVSVSGVHLAVKVNVLNKS